MSGIIAEICARGGIRVGWVKVWSTGYANIFVG